MRARRLNLPDLAGHWRREAITAPGMEDRTTRVHWLQAACGGFCDIRVPACRPDLTGCDRLSELGPAQLLPLMDGFGFAGTTAVDGSRVTWSRAISAHGGPPEADIGILRPGPGGRWIEDGAEAPYREIWAHRPMECMHGVWQNGDRRCLITWSDSLFLLAIGTPTAASTLPLRQALEAGQVPDGLSAHFDGEYTFGHWDGDTGIATLSTNPLREGEPRLSRAALDADTLTLSQPDFNGTEGRTVWTR